MVALAILALIVIMPDAYALDLTGPGPNDLPTDTPVPTAAGLTATHTIDFTTATAGLIDSVDITFPANFDISGVGVGVPTGIGAGTVAAVGQVVTYTVDVPVNVPADTAITIELTGVVNALVGNYTVTVETKDPVGVTIDGPTESYPFAITPAPLIGVTNTVNPTTRGVPATHTIGFTTATTATIASVDILFPAGFDVFSVAVGTVTGIGEGTVSIDGQVVTYTVDVPVNVPADTDITIELTGVVNAPAGSYTVVVETKDAAGATIDGPTESDPFAINPVGILTDVTDTVVPITPGSTATHTVGFTTATTATIASVDILFPAGFDVSGVGVGNVVNIGAGDVAAESQVVTYTVTDPVEVAAGTAITIELTNVVNAPVGNYTVMVETKDATGAAIDGPTQSAPFEIGTPGSIEFVQLSKYYTMPEGDQVPVGTTHYTTSGRFPDDFDDASETSPDSKPDQVVIGALKRGADNVPMMKVVVTGNSAGTTVLESLTVSYAGTRLVDVGSYASLYEAFYHPNGELKSAILKYERSIADGTVTFEIADSVIPANGTRNFIVVLDIASGAGTYDVDLRAKAINGYPEIGFIENGEIVPNGNIGEVVTPNPDGYAHIDASAPELIVTADVTPEYDTATKVLTLKFKDGGGIGTITKPRVNVVADSDGDTAWKVDLSKIKIRAVDDLPSLTNLTGASFLYPDYPGGTVDPTDYEIEDKWADADGDLANQAAGNYGVVKIKLTAAQDVFIQHNILPEETEIYINGALKDYRFGNAIGELENTLHVIGDATSPSLAEKKPVSFDYKTQVLTLTFNESIDASEVELANIYIMNYMFDPEADADPDLPERIIVDLDFVMNLRDASVVEGYGETVTITLTPEQRDILKGDHPQVYLDDGAVEDIAGNPNDRLNPAIVAGSVDEFIDYIDEKYEAGEYPDIGAADVYVTPPILSGVDSKYHGNLRQVKQVSFDYPEDYHQYDAVLDLKFTEELSTDVDATKITVTNENGEQPFALTQSQYDSILSEDSRIMRLLLTKRSKTSHKAKISYWQLENSGIDELHIEVGTGAVRDVNGNYNEPMELSERIYWIKDTEGPRVTDATSYGHSSQVLKLAFDECIDLESDNIENLVDLEKITLEAYDGDLAGDSLTLNKDEDVITTGQETGVYLQITLSDNHRDIISSWDFAGGTQFILSTSTGAVHDIAGNTNPNYSGGYPKKNWIEDTVRPTFISPAYYSIGEKLERLLVLWFSEPIYDGDIADYKPDLSKIEVHPAAEPANKRSLEDATYVVSGDESYTALNIDLSGTSPAIVDVREILEEKINPQVDIDDGAVYDLARNGIRRIADRAIMLDFGGPSPVTNFTASNRTDTTIDLTWTNPPDEDFAGTLIVRSQDLITWNPTVGVIYSIDEEVAPGVIVRFSGAEDHSTEPFTDTGLVPEATYCYKAFAYDTWHRYSKGAGTSTSPPLLNGVESVYYGNLRCVFMDCIEHPEDYHKYDAVLDLKFTEELSTDVDATKITVTNENGEQPFTLAQSQYDSILSADSRIMRLLLTKRSKTYQKAKIAFWQREDSGIDELHIKLDAGAVRDVNGTPNPKMEESEKIVWEADTEGPRVTDASSYSHSSQLLKLAFDECIDLESDNIDNLVDLSKVELEAYNGDLAGDRFTLNEDEDLIKPGQKTGVYLSITLSDDHRNIISSWDFAGGTYFILKTSTGAVYDIVGNTKPNYSAGYPKKNWSEDSVRPTFVSPAYYSIDEQMLVLRFSEPIYDGDMAQYRPDLSKIEVHPAAEPANRKSLATAIYVVSGDVLKIDVSGTFPALVDVREILEEKSNPQVNILANAVHDLARNAILQILDRSITLDLAGPELSSTGNTYEHISLDDEDNLVTDGLVTLNFTEVVDGKSIKLSKIKLQAGTTSVDLSGAVNAITGVAEFPNATTFKMKITDDDKVGKIASWQREYYPNLFVALEAEAVADLTGNLNVEDIQAIETWTGDTRKPEIKLRESYYIHDLKERSDHYARLVLVFDEPMDPRPAYIEPDGIILTDGGDNAITLTAEEIKPDQDFSNEIQFNLTDAHRDIISVWGEPKVIGSVTDSGGGDKTTLYIYLAENSVTDRAGNSVVILPTAKAFAKSAAFSDDGDGIDERKYDSDLAADPWKEEGIDYSSWEKDLKPAEFVSGAYNANNRLLTVTFDEWMDVKPVGLADSTKIRIYDEDYLSVGEYVDLAGGVTENEKTKTITVTLTTEKGVAVNALKTPLYIALRSEDTTPVPDGILDVGPARDIAGQVCEAIGPIADTKISYTADTTKPTLVRTNGDDTTYRHKGKDFGAPDDITGLLSLVFNEGVDKDYYAIDATKIRLSNTSTDGGFVLTQDEIHTAPGFRVYPLAPTYVHIIQFDLNDEHWNTVANEKWDTMWIQMEAGAISDTAFNAIAAVTMDIHPDHYHSDAVMPEVDIITEVSSASAGQDIPITATVVDDSPIVEVRLYYQVGGQVRTYDVMENTTGNTYEATIPGTAVTNKGLCYYVWAKDLWDNENITGNGNIKTKGGDWWYTNIPGGFNVKVTDAVVELPAVMFPEFYLSAIPSAYRMISVPIDATLTSTDLFAPFGTAGEDWKAWKYTGIAEYSGYQPGHITPFTFSPGIAAWIGMVKQDNALTVTGSTSQVSEKYDDSDVAGKRYLHEITLHAEWNQIGTPFNFSKNWDETTIDLDGGNISHIIYWFSGETLDYSFASTNLNVPNQSVFADSWTGSGIPENNLVWQGWPGSLDPWGGYWVLSYKEGAVLKIDPTVPGKATLPVPPTAPSVQMPYNWSVKVMPEVGGIPSTAKFAGIVSDATDGIDKYDVMDLPPLPDQTVRLSFITEAGDYLQDMKAPADEMFWHFKVSSAANMPVTLRFDASAVPSEYRTVLLIDTVTDAATDLRKVASYAYKSSDTSSVTEDVIRNFKLIISKAHPETYIIPKRSTLLQNYPNPFNPETWVPYRLAKSGDVKIKIYNVAGQLVRTLELGHREAGSYTVKERAAYWNGRNVTGERVASGVYFYHIQSGSFHTTKRMVIVK